VITLFMTHLVTSEHCLLLKIVFFKKGRLIFLAYEAPFSPEYWFHLLATAVVKETKKRLPAQFKAALHVLQCIVSYALCKSAAIKAYCWEL
jgi:hypothetical protein